MSERVGNYEVQALLGKADPSAVYRGSDGKRAVSLKCVARAGVDTAAVARLKAAAPQLAELRGASIAGFIEVVENDKMVCVVSQLPEGAPLVSRLPAGPDLKLAWNVARDLLEALREAHAAGVVHGNLKPDNIFVDAQARLTLADFGTYGLARVRDATALAFASPEHIDGGELTARSDLYQVVALVYRIATGKPPFTGSREEIARRIRSDPPADPSSVAPKIAWQLDWVIKRGLAKNPAERFGGARELLESLRLGLQESLGTALQLPPAPAPVAPRMPKPAAAVARPAPAAAPIAKPQEVAPSPTPVASAPKPQPAAAAPKAQTAPPPQPVAAAPKPQPAPPPAAAAPKPQPAAAAPKPPPPEPQSPAAASTPPEAEWEMELDPKLDKMPPAPPPLPKQQPQPAGERPMPKQQPQPAAERPTTAGAAAKPQTVAPAPKPAPPPPPPAAGAPSPQPPSVKPPHADDSLVQKARMLAAAKPAQTAANADIDDNGKVKVLFVDDEERVLNGLRALFRNDYQVFTADNGAAALELVKRHQIPVVVSDQRMPTMTGVDLLRQVRAIAPQSVRLLLTGYTDLAAMVGSINDGEVFRFVRKPWENDEIRAILAEAATVAVKQSAGEAPQSAAKAKSPRTAGSILVIDQGEGLARGLQRLVAGAAQVERASSPQDAAKILMQREFACVVADFAAGRDGLITLFKLLKSQRPQTRAILIADDPDSELVASLINQAQIYRFLSKPVDPRELRANVAMALRRYAAYKEGSGAKDGGTAAKPIARAG